MWSPSCTEVLFIPVCAGLSLKIATYFHSEGLNLNPTSAPTASKPCQGPRLLMVRAGKARRHLTTPGKMWKSSAGYQDQRGREI